MRPLPPGELCPHSAIRKYIGTSIISHRKKNRNRSSVRNTPTTPPRFHSRLRWKKPTLRSISRQEQATAITPSRLVSTTSSKARPSTPRYSELQHGKHPSRET